MCDILYFISLERARPTDCIYFYNISNIFIINTFFEENCFCTNIFANLVCERASRCYFTCTGRYKIFKQSSVRASSWSVSMLAMGLHETGNNANALLPTLTIVGRTWSAKANKLIPLPLADEGTVVHRALRAKIGDYNRAERKS